MVGKSKAFALRMVLGLTHSAWDIAMNVMSYYTCDESISFLNMLKHINTYPVYAPGIVYVPPAHWVILWHLLVGIHIPSTMVRTWIMVGYGQALTWESKLITILNFGKHTK